MLKAESLSAPELAATEARMRPGQLSEEGFLLPEQSLLKVIAQDSAYLLEQRISHEQIADRLTTLIARARRFEQIERRRGRSAQSALVDDFSITLESSLGTQECPFRAEESELCGQGCSDFEITNLLTNESIKVSELALHLIREHPSQKI